MRKPGRRWARKLGRRWLEFFRRYPPKPALSRDIERQRFEESRRHDA